MDATTNDAVLNAEQQPASTEGGEPQGSAEGGEVGKEASGKEGTTGEAGLFDGMTAEQLHKSYKSLQGEYTKGREVLKQFERFGGPDQLVRWAEYLSSNPEFSKWVQSQQTKNVLGVDESQLDPETKSAYDTVRKISENIADSKLRQLVQQEITPISETLKAQLLDNHFDAMDKKYGADWQEMRDTMSELSEELPPQIQDRPTLEDIEDLYFKALRKSGKFDSYAAKQYGKQLNDKKGKSTEKGVTRQTSEAKPSKSIAEAFAEAKRSMNL